MQKIAFILMLTILVASFSMQRFAFSDIVVYGQEERWVPYVPLDMDLAFWEENNNSYVEATITFPVLALNVSDWGIPIRNGSNISVDSKIWRLISDVYLQVFQVLSYTYDLGCLEDGSYTFTFLAWSLPVKSISFAIGKSNDLNDDGIVDIKDVRIVAKAFDSSIGDERWNAEADLNGDGFIDMRDIRIIAKNFGKTL